MRGTTVLVNDSQHIFFSIQGSGDDAGSKSPDANDFDDEDGNGITIDVAKEPGVKFSSLVEDEK